MNDGTPTLAYAGPGLPPQGSRFAVEHHADGVTLSQPMGARPILAVGLILTAALMLIGTAMAVTLSSGLECCILAGGTGVVALLAVTHLQTVRARVLTISLRAGRLTVRNDPGRLWGLPWTVRQPRGFRSTVVRPSLLRLGVVSNLRVRTRFGVERDVLVAIPVAECVWLASQLAGTLDRGVAKPNADDRG